MRIGSPSEGSWILTANVEVVALAKETGTFTINTVQEAKEASVVRANVSPVPGLVAAHNTVAGTADVAGSLVVHLTIKTPVASIEEVIAKSTTAPTTIALRSGSHGGNEGSSNSEELHFDEERG